MSPVNVHACRLAPEILACQAAGATSTARTTSHSVTTSAEPPAWATQVLQSVAAAARAPSPNGGPNPLAAAYGANVAGMGAAERRELVGGWEHILASASSINRSWILVAERRKDDMPKSGTSEFQARRLDTQSTAAWLLRKLNSTTPGGVGAVSSAFPAGAYAYGGGATGLPPLPPPGALQGGSFPAGAVSSGLPVGSLPLGEDVSPPLSVERDWDVVARVRMGWELPVGD